jgi:dihydrofolate reductase
VSVPLVLVAAVARNGVIGDNNRLLWRLPSDLQHFKGLTMGKPLIMGRRTFESIGRLLPGRETIVITRNRGFPTGGALTAQSLETALDLGSERAVALGADEIVIAGGAEIYAQTIGRADRLLITEVALAPPGNARFPVIDPAIWREVRRQQGQRRQHDDADFAFVDYERRR